MALTVGQLADGRTSTIERSKQNLVNPLVCGPSSYCASGNEDHWRRNFSADLERSDAMEHMHLLTVPSDARSKNEEVELPPSAHWVRATRAHVHKFSAVCWFMGVSLSDALAASLSAVQGQPIAPFLPRTAQDPRCPANSGGGEIFNAMISPLLRLQFTAVHWYQGEFNTHDDGRLYACLLRQLIRELRRRTKQPELFVGIVQLAPMTGLGFGDDREGVPGIRSAEAAVAKELFPFGALATAADLGEPWSAAGNIHSMVKQPLGARLAACMLRHAHEYRSLRGNLPPSPHHCQFGGPRVISATPAAAGVRVQFDEPLVFRPNACPFAVGVASSAFLDEAPWNVDTAKLCAGWELRCGGLNGSWVAARAVLDSDGMGATVEASDVSALTSPAVGVRYAWAPWPVMSLFTSPLEKDESSLPLMPAWLELSWSSREVVL